MGNIENSKFILKALEKENLETYSIHNLDKNIKLEEPSINNTDTMISLVKEIKEYVLKVDRNVEKVDLTTCESNERIHELTELLKEAREEIKNNSFFKILLFFSSISCIVSGVVFIFSVINGGVMLTSYHIALLFILSLIFVIMSALTEKYLKNDRKTI